METLVQPIPWQTVLNKREEVNKLLQEHGYVLYSQTIPHPDNVAIRLYVVKRNDKDISDIAALLFQNDITVSIVNCNYFYNLIEIDVCITDDISFIIRPTIDQNSTLAFETYKNDLMLFADSYADFLANKGMEVVSKDIKVIGKSIFNTKYDVYTDPRTTIIYVELLGNCETLAQIVKVSISEGFYIIDVIEKLE